MTSLDWVVLAILVLSTFLGVLRGSLALLGLAFPKPQIWQHALTRAPLEHLASKIHPWLPSDLAALIRF